MQPNTIVLAVDPLNDSNVVPETYERFEEFQNRSVYIGESHLPESRDTINLYRSFPTKSGNFKGVSKTSIKSTVDHEVDGVDGISNVTAPLIIEIGFSCPVGVTAAQVIHARQRILALLDDDTIMTALNNQLMV
jgi:hypothetical protein